jgi:peptidoglycan hydrolase-like protein with peptidoglycan-binding domain
MPRIHTAAAGECISSIGFDNGFFPETLWELAQNAGLRAQREDLHILREGDRIYIPDIESKQETGATDLRHRFKRKGVPEVLRIRFLDEYEKPRPNLAYELKIGARLIKGATDANGWLVEWIPNDAMEAALVVTDASGKAPVEEEYRLQLGRLNPSHDPPGIRARLEHFGLACGDTDEELALAISSFQRRHQLPVTGKADDQTIAKLKEHHLS